MRFISFLIPCVCVSASAQSISLTLGPCNPSHIQLFVQPFPATTGQYVLLRDGIVFTNEFNNPTNDRAPIKPIHYYQVKNGNKISEKIGGRLCPIASILPPLSYPQSEYRSQSIDFQWTALHQVDTYQCQIARNKSNFSLETGFAANAILVDTVLTTNQFLLAQPRFGTDTLYWAVRPVVPSKVSYFTNPITNIRVNTTRFAAPNSRLKLQKLQIKQNNISLEVQNPNRSTLELHYFWSDTPTFHLGARLLTSRMVSSFARQTVTQLFYWQSMKGYLIVVPSVNGVWLGKEFAISTAIP